VRDDSPAYKIRAKKSRLLDHKFAKAIAHADRVHTRCKHERHNGPDYHTVFPLIKLNLIPGKRFNVNQTENVKELILAADFQCNPAGFGELIRADSLVLHKQLAAGHTYILSADFRVSAVAVKQAFHAFINILIQ
jgi:hypothetical protein